MVLTGTKDDPSVRMLRSGIGKQVKSDHENAPEWGFGTGHRDAADKVRTAQLSPYWIGNLASAHAHI